MVKGRQGVAVWEGGGGRGGSNSRLYCIPVDKAMLESEAELSFIKLKLKYL